MNEIKAFRLILTGKVQGVNLRQALKGMAHDLGLSGYVKNLSNSSVEVVAQGPQLALTQFVNFCKQGSAMAKVESVQIFPTEISSKNTFEIIN